MAAEIDLGKVIGDKGEQGVPGSQWYYGTAITGTESTGTVFSGTGIENAEVNDKYLNTGTGSDSGNVYTCVLSGDANTAQWSYAGSIRGAQGPQGPQGATGAVDENTPIEFTEAETLTNLSSGESISVLFGKIAKAVSGLLSGAASTLLSALTENRALISDDNGKVVTSSVTKTELEYLSGAESNIQDQLDELNQKIFSYKISFYNVDVTTQYPETIGYIGSINLTQQSDYPGSDKFIAAIPIGCCSEYDSSRVAICGNIYPSKTTFMINAPKSGPYYLTILYLYKNL